MSAEPALESFLNLVQRSGVVPEDQLQQFTDEFSQRRPELDSSRKIADELVAREALTRWQADQLLRGKHRGFFLGSYRILKLLGEGGMGTVYLAEHQMMRRRCAIKVLPSKSRKDESSIELFYREAQAIAALDHPNIVRAYDVNKDFIDETEFHYLVMEYVDGQDLQRMVEKRGVFDFPRATDYIRQAAEGLGHAHQRGFVHRDVKPANLLVDPNGVVKVLDLGLARFFDDANDIGSDSSVARKRSESVLGTADYLAPEQALNSHDVDARADIYGLGQTFYFLLMGHAPFPKGTIAERLLAHQTKYPDPILKSRPDVPPDLVAIIDRMTAKRPEHRYPTAAEVVETLEEWLRDHREDESSSLRRSPLLGEGARQSLRTRPRPSRAGSAASEEAELELAPLDDDEPPPPPDERPKDVEKDAKKDSKRSLSTGTAAASSQESPSAKAPGDSPGTMAKQDSGSSLLDDLPELPEADPAAGAVGMAAASAPIAGQGLLGTPGLKKRKQESALAAVLTSPVLWVSIGGLAVLVLILAIVFSGPPGDKPEDPVPDGGKRGSVVKPPEVPAVPKPPDGPPGEPGVIVSSDSTWKWLHPSDGVDPATSEADFHTTFYAIDYDDSHWQTGQDSPGKEGGFGYGDDAAVAWDKPEKGKRYTAYLRYTFTAGEAWEKLYLTLQRDDGIIVYLDGKEVARDTMGDAEEAYDLFAEEIISRDDEVEINRYDLIASLEPGEHVLAISLHNRSGDSSDLRIAEISLNGVCRAAEPPEDDGR